MRPDVGEEMPAVKLGEGLSRQRGEGAGTTWARGSLVWVGVGCTSDRTQGSRALGGHSSKPQSTEIPNSPPLAPATFGAPCRLTLGRGHLEGN